MSYSSKHVELHNALGLIKVSWVQPEVFCLILFAFKNSHLDVVSDALIPLELVFSDDAGPRDTGHSKILVEEGDILWVLVKLNLYLLNECLRRQINLNFDHLWILYNSLLPMEDTLVSFDCILMHILWLWSRHVIAQVAIYLVLKAGETRHLRCTLKLVLKHFLWFLDILLARTHFIEWLIARR